MAGTGKKSLEFEDNTQTILAEWLVRLIIDKNQGEKKRQEFTECTLRGIQELICLQNQLEDSWADKNRDMGLVQSLEKEDQNECD